MPAISCHRGRRRASTSSLLIPRSLSGFSDTVSWPRLMLDQPEVMPMVLPTLSTAGSASSTSTTRRCRSAMAAKLTSGLPTVLPDSSPVSWIGRKPLGT